MKLVVGLGNPGDSYVGTRHNVGFEAIERLASRWGCGLERDKRLQARLGKTRQGGDDVLLVQPLSYMNLSGVPVARLLADHTATAAELIVVVDDAALELGTIRVRERGSHGGHNGLRSLVEELETEEFVRVRVGVGHGEVPDDLAAFVLGEFAGEDLDRVEQVVARAAAATEVLAADGAAAAMNQFNGAIQRPGSTEP